MGIETAVLLAVGAKVGATFLKARAETKQAKNESRAVVERANIQASNEAKRTRARAATAKVSFINSGITLEGTASTAIQGVFSAGIQDIEQISSNANMSARNIMARARTKNILAYANLASDLATSAATGGMGGGATPVPGVGGSGIPQGGFSGQTGVPNPYTTPGV